MIANIKNFNSHPQYYASYEQIMQEIWPKIILQSDVVKTYYDQLFQYFPNYQKVCINTENEVIGFINTIPIHWEKSLEDLPEEGWDWLIQKGISDYKNNIVPNTLGGLQIGISKAYQGRGLSKKIVEIGKSIQRKSKFKNFILPIRPTLKHLHPRLSMEEYLLKKTAGKIYDPWIRIHNAGGAKIIKVCHRSMVIEGSITDWEKWSGMKFEKTGNYILEGALHEILMDLAASKSIYYEANIWLYYA